MNKFLFFDLDGTLTDPFKGITASILYALRKMGRECPGRDSLRAFIGPPLIPSFRSVFGMSEEEAEEAVRLYREYYAERGIFENRLYPGIPELLGRLGKAGRILCLATSKPEPFAKRILEHFSIDGYFREVAGASMDQSRTAKADVLRELIRRLESERAILTDARLPKGADTGSTAETGEGNRSPSALPRLRESPVRNSAGGAGLRARILRDTGRGPLPPTESGSAVPEGGDSIKENALMIGDRRHDAEGASELGIPAAGVLWGYGSEEELRRAGCVGVFSAPELLGDWLLGKPARSADSTEEG